MSIAAEVGQRIRFYRKERKMSQEHLAEVCNFHPTYIGQLERGEKMQPLRASTASPRALKFPWASYWSILTLLKRRGKVFPFRSIISCSPCHRRSKRRPRRCGRTFWSLWSDFKESQKPPAGRTYGFAGSFFPIFVGFYSFYDLLIPRYIFMENGTVFQHVFFFASFFFFIINLKP